MLKKVSVFVLVMGIIFIIGCATEKSLTVSESTIPEDSKIPQNLPADLPVTDNINPAASVMTLTSPAFEDEGNIPSKYTCDGEDINPVLKVDNIPPETLAVVLIVDDPDAPAGAFVHWITWMPNLGASGIEIPEHWPAHYQGKNDFGNNKYQGPCPPSGEHRYNFRLFALDFDLDLPENVTKMEIVPAIEDYVLAEAHLLGKYQKK